MKKNNIEISVQQASRAINVTSRTILNYIKSREIEATKVGKSWFIKEPSFRSFARKYKLVIDENRIGGEGPDSIQLEEVEQVLLEEIKAGPSKAPAAEKSLPSKKIKKNKYIIDTLKLYQVAHNAFFTTKWANLEANKGPSLLLKRVIQLRFEAIELVGAGYYSFDKREKRNLYNRSREKTGSILALFYTDKNLQKEWASEISFIENQLLAAYSSLIRKMEKTSERN